MDEQNHLGLERLIFFSDAVFAIAITLLALEIRLPPGQAIHSDGELLAALIGIWPRYLSYAVSFLVLACIGVALWNDDAAKLSWIALVPLLLVGAGSPKQAS